MATESMSFDPNIPTTSSSVHTSPPPNSNETSIDMNGLANYRKMIRRRKKKLTMINRRKKPNGQVNIKKSNEGSKKNPLMTAKWKKLNLRQSVNEKEKVDVDKVIYACCYQYYNNKYLKRIQQVLSNDLRKQSKSSYIEPSEHDVIDGMDIFAFDNEENFRTFSKKQCLSYVEQTIERRKESQPNESEMIYKDLSINQIYFTRSLYGRRKRRKILPDNNSTTISSSNVPQCVSEISPEVNNVPSDHPMPAVSTSRTSFDDNTKENDDNTNVNPKPIVKPVEENSIPTSNLSQNDSSFIDDGAGFTSRRSGRVIKPTSRVVESGELEQLEFDSFIGYNSKYDREFGKRKGYRVNFQEEQTKQFLSKLSNHQNNEDKIQVNNRTLMDNQNQSKESTSKITATNNNKIVLNKKSKLISTGEPNKFLLVNSENKIVMIPSSKMNDQKSNNIKKFVWIPPGTGTPLSQQTSILMKNKSPSILLGQKKVITNTKVVNEQLKPTSNQNATSKQEVLIKSTQKPTIIKPTITVQQPPNAILTPFGWCEIDKINEKLPNYPEQFLNKFPYKIQFNYADNILNKIKYHENTLRLIDHQKFEMLQQKKKNQEESTEMSKKFEDVLRIRYEKSYEVYMENKKLQDEMRRKNFLKKNINNLVKKVLIKDYSKLLSTTGTDSKSSFKLHREPTILRRITPISTNTKQTFIKPICRSEVKPVPEPVAAPIIPVIEISEETNTSKTATTTSNINNNNNEEEEDVILIS